MVQWQCCRLWPKFHQFLTVACRTWEQLSLNIFLLVFEASNQKILLLIKHPHGPKEAKTSFCITRPQRVFAQPAKNGGFKKVANLVFCAGFPLIFPVCFGSVAFAAFFHAKLPYRQRFGKQFFFENFPKKFKKFSHKQNYIVTLRKTQTGSVCSKTPKNSGEKGI